MAATLEAHSQDAADKPLADAIVFLESPQPKAAVKPVHGTEIAQINRQFTPQVTVVPLGTSVQFPNKDTVRHDVYSFLPLKFELFYGRSGQDGKLALDNVPPGNYRLRIWHQNLAVGAPATDQALSLAATGQSVTVKVSGLTP